MLAQVSELRPVGVQVEKLIKSDDNEGVSFMITLNFDIQNLIDFRSLGIFPKN